MSFLRKYWKKYRVIFICSVLCVGMESLCDLIQPQIMASLIDNGVNRLDLQYVIKTALLMLGITGAGAAFACMRNVLSSKASQSFGADMRKDLFVKIQNLPIYESDRFDGGSLVTRMTNDVTQLTNFINGLMRIFFKAPVTCIGAIILSISLNIHTVPIVLGIVFIASIVTFLSMKLSYPVFAKVQNALDHLNTTVREYLMGIRLVRAFGRQEYEKERFDHANENLSKTTIKANRILSVFSPITNLAINSGVAVIIIIGARLVGKGDMKVGQIVAFITYMTQILASFSMITNILNTFIRTRASYMRIAEIMNITQIENIANSNERMNLSFHDTIADFKNVSFKYPLSSGEMALQNIHFTIKRGQLLGIIGPTGSGKSSLAALLLGFYQATEGSILFGNENIRNIPEGILRRHISIVPQAPMLFSGSIKENILWGNNNASQSQILAAAKTAQAYDFIMNTPHKLETELGQGGINLSGGQKQRLSIARALAGSPDLLILDDCTSALDSLTESKVRQGLKKYSKDLSCILISQRISSIISADKILVLDSGSQAGFGSHIELMQSCGVYRDIFYSQMGKV